jgi:hypothetical protein
MGLFSKKRKANKRVQKPFAMVRFNQNEKCSEID